MKVWVIQRPLVNWDGWSVGNGQILQSPTFTTQDEAWAWCAEADRVEPNQDRNHYHYTASVVDVEVPK